MLSLNQEGVSTHLHLLSKEYTLRATLMIEYVNTHSTLSPVADIQAASCTKVPERM